MPDLDLVVVVDTEPLSVTEDVTDIGLELVIVVDETVSGTEVEPDPDTIVSGSVDAPEFVALQEDIVVVQDGELFDDTTAENLELSEQTDYVLAAFEESDLEEIDLSEVIVVVLIPEVGTIIEQPVEGPPPPETVPPLPDIVTASYQEDGLAVRVFHIDETEATVDVGDTTTRQGIQLTEWVADGNVIHPYSLPTPSRYNVDQERDRRLALGIMITLGSGRMLAVQTRGLEDFRNITFLVTTAATVPIDQILRDAYNLIQTVTALEMIELGAQLTARVQEYYEAGWTLKDLTDIPFDYQADSYWPDYSYPLEPPSGY
jgi:hypothetical protein